MKILMDTNVLISAFIFGGQAGTLLNVLLDSEHELYVSDYIDREFYEKLQEKWPQKAEKVYSLYHKMDIKFCNSVEDVLGNLRDKKDEPVLSDAIYHHIDMILTGDRDFLEAEIERPLIYSPSMMLEYLKRH